MQRHTHGVKPPTVCHIFFPVFRLSAGGAAANPPGSQATVHLAPGVRVRVRIRVRVRVRVRVRLGLGLGLGLQST